MSITSLIGVRIYYKSGNMHNVVLTEQSPYENKDFIHSLTISKNKTKTYKNRKEIKNDEKNKQ